MNTPSTEVDNLYTLPIHNAQEEFEKFEMLQTFFAYEGNLPHKESKEINDLFKNIEGFLYELGPKGNTEDFLYKLHELNRVIEEMMQEYGAHMYQDVKLILELFYRNISKATTENLTEKIFDDVEKVLII